MTMKPDELQRRILKLESLYEILKFDLYDQIKDLRKRIIDLEKKKDGVKPKTS